MADIQFSYKWMNYSFKATSPLSSTLSSLALGWLVGQLCRDTPLCLFAFFSFLIRFHITARTKSLTTRCDSVFFIPKNPVRPEHFYPLCLPLPFSSRCFWQPSGPYYSKWASATHCVPSVETPFWLSSGQSGDQSCSYSSKMWWISICSWRLLWAAFVLNPTLPRGSRWSGWTVVRL